MATYRELADEFLWYTKTDRYPIKNLRPIPYEFYLNPENREFLKETIRGILRFKYLKYVSWDYKAYFLEIIKILILNNDKGVVEIVSMLKNQNDFDDLINISSEIISRDNAEVFKLLFLGCDYNPGMKALFQVFRLSQVGSRIMDLVLSRDNPLLLTRLMKEHLVKYIAYYHLPLLSEVDEEFKSLVCERSKLELESKSFPEQQTIEEYAEVLQSKISVFKQYA